MIKFRLKKFADIPSPGAYLKDTAPQAGNSNNLNPNSQAQQQQEQQITSKDLLIQQMRLQRQIMITQQQRQKLQNQETMAQMRQLNQKSKAENDKDNQQNSQNIRTNKMEQENAKPDNTGLYKTKSKIIPPVSMKT